jgi:phosphoglycolate phosphatase
MKKGIIFDMDGTLWDSAIGVAESWNIVIKKSGYERAPLTENDIKGVMGLTMDRIADILFPDLSEKKRRELLGECCEVENAYLREHGGILYPKVRETMEELKKDYPLYIVSNCQSGYIEAFLDHYKFWDLVEDIECYGNNELPKSENIALVCRRNNLDDAVYVGDIQGDYDSSVAAGVKFIHAAYGFGTINKKVPAIKSFEELSELLLVKRYIEW